MHVADTWRVWGERIRSQRTGVYTQKQLADLLEVDQSTVSRWENGEPPTDAMKVRLAAVFNVPVAELFAWAADQVAS